MRLSGFSARGVVGGSVTSGGTGGKTSGGGVGVGRMVTAKARPGLLMDIPSIAGQGLTCLYLGENAS